MLKSTLPLSSRRVWLCTTCVVAAMLLVGCGGAARSTQGPGMDRNYGGGDSAEADVYVTAADSDGALFDDVYEPMQNEHAYATSKKASYNSPPVETAQADGEPKEEPAPADGPDAKKKGQRIIIYSANLMVAVLEVEAALEATQAKTEALDGWVQASTSTSITVRVPSAHFNEFLAAIRDLGRVDQENITGTDVTEEFMDLEIRLQNAVDLRNRYAALLEKAENVQEALAIEQELARITGEIESMKGRIRFLTEQSSYSRVTISFVQRSEVAPKKRHIALPFPWLQSYNLPTVYAGRYGY